LSCKYTRPERKRALESFTALAAGITLGRICAVPNLGSHPIRLPRSNSRSSNSRRSPRTTNRTN